MIHCDLTAHYLWRVTSIEPCATLRLSATTTVEGDFLWRVNLKEFASGGEKSKVGAFVFDETANRSFSLSVLTSTTSNLCRQAAMTGVRELCSVQAPEYGVIEFRRTGANLYGRFTDDGELDQSSEIQNEEDWVLESSYVGMGLFLRVPLLEEMATAPSTTATFEDSSLSQPSGEEVVDSFDCNSIE